MRPRAVPTLRIGSDGIWVLMCRSSHEGHPAADCHRPLDPRMVRNSGYRTHLKPGRDEQCENRAGSYARVQRRGREDGDRVVPPIAEVAREIQVNEGTLRNGRARRRGTAAVDLEQRARLREFEKR